MEKEKVGPVKGPIGVSLELDGIRARAELDHVVMVFVEKLVVSIAEVTRAVLAELCGA